MAFHNVRIDNQYTVGCQIGPNFRTEPAESKGGRQQRNIVRAQPGFKFDIGHNVKSPTQIATLIDFFWLRQGMAHSFRAKDPNDYQVTTNNFGTGDGATVAFQLRQVKSDAAATFYRTITKPVSGTILIYKNAVLQTETTHYTINYSTGIVTFVTAPANGLALTWTGEFDICVHFASDLAQFDWKSVENRGWQSIMLEGVDE